MTFNSSNRTIGNTNRMTLKTTRRILRNTRHITVLTMGNLRLATRNLSLRVLNLTILTILTTLIRGDNILIRLLPNFSRPISNTLSINILRNLLLFILHNRLLLRLIRNLSMLRLPLRNFLTNGTRNRRKGTITIRRMRNNLFILDDNMLNLIRRFRRDTVLHHRVFSKTRRVFVLFSRSFNGIPTKYRQFTILNKWSGFIRNRCMPPYK